jgi:hypothetical protein
VGGVTVASIRMQVTPCRVLSATRTPGSVPCRATTCVHAQRRAALTAAISFFCVRAPPLPISSSVRYAVGTDATCPNASA